MASPYSAGGGEAPEVQPEVQPELRPEVIEEMAQAIRVLEAELQHLRATAGGAYVGLGEQIGDAQRNAATAAQVATSAKTSTIRIPQPQRFKGNREGPKVLEWAHQATTYLKAAGMDQGTAGVWHISNFFDSDAAVWWRLQCDRFDRGELMAPTDWNQLKSALISQFQIFNHETDIRDQYSSLRQTASVSAYITKFRSLVVELPNEPEDHKIYQFLKGLKPEIQARTRTHKPKTLGAAMDIADEADRAHYHAYRGAATSTRSAAGTSRGTGPTPMQIGAIVRGELNAILQPHELQRLRQENRCFECRKEGHLAKDCPKRKRRRKDARGGKGRRSLPSN